VVKEASTLRKRDGPGPVLIDLPKNVQQAKGATGVSERGERARLQSGFARERSRIERSHWLIEKSERPCCTWAAGSSPKCEHELRVLRDWRNSSDLDNYGLRVRFRKPIRFHWRWLGMHGNGLRELGE